MFAGRVNVPGPPRRYRRLPWRAVEFAALDFETTGLDYANDTIVSFGIVPVRRGRIVLADGVHQLVDPHIPPSPRSQTIHELRPQDLAGSPRLTEAREILADALARRFLLAWFAEVEINFLSAIFGIRESVWRRRTIDVRNLAIEADGGPRSIRSQPGYGLSWAADRLGVPVASPHDALDDALVTAQAFLVLTGRLPDRPDPTAGDLLELAGDRLRVERRFKLAV
jgi:DNA polymerase-3 subunit epsilon